MIPGPCEFPVDELDGRHEQPGGCAFDGVLEVLGEATVSVEPSKGPLDDPAHWQEFEPLGGIGWLYDFECPFADLVERRAQFLAGIAAVGKDVVQPREATHDSCHERRTVTVLDIGAVDGRVEEIAAGIGEDVALASFDLLANVIAANDAAFGGFDALAVGDTGARAGLTTHGPAHRHQQTMVDRRPDTTVDTGAKHLGNIRHAPPLGAARRDVQPRVHNLAHVRRPPPTSALRRRNERRRQQPFALRHIAWIAQTFPAMSTPGNTSPSHGSLHLFAKTVESQDAGIAQLLSDQALRQNSPLLCLSGSATLFTLLAHKSRLRVHQHQAALGQ
jgi:hypothetical protein